MLMNAISDFFKILPIGKLFISICIEEVNLKYFKNYFSWWSFHLRGIEIVLS